MSDFENKKKHMINQNEQQYGKEIREKYGDKAIDASNAKLMGMSPEQYEQAQKLSNSINDGLIAAMKNGDPACEQSQNVCDLHKQWICMFWQEGAYNKQAHMGLGEMYVADERFKKYYDDACGEGAAEFLRDALALYTRE